MPITLLYIGLGVAAMFISLPMSTSSAVIYGFLVAPMPYIIMFAKLSGNTMFMLLSFASSIAACLAVIAIAILIFNRDVVVLGIRVSVRKRRE